MISIYPFRTRRITANMRELSIGDAEYLCGLPANMHERNTSEFLARVLQRNEIPVAGQVEDPRMWSVNEREAVKAHYLMSMNPAEPDFPIQNLRYSNFLIEDGQDFVPIVNIGTHCDSEWMLAPLLGYEAEAIERLAVQGPSSRLLWWTCCMAFQLVRPEDDQPADLSDDSIDEYLAQRFMFFNSLPESDFAELFLAFLEGQRKLDHFLVISVDEEGLVALPSPATQERLKAAHTGQEVPGLPSARFPLRSMVSAATLAILGVADGAEG